MCREHIIGEENINFSTAERQKGKQDLSIKSYISFDGIYQIMSYLY